ncbi:MULTISPECIES: TetR/AcrR family transcriptional regulator [Prauserella salsuginis group]|uniref:TetR/AcrR family transcriptional regulator n=1 Tax=Prauserella salsuginis TaxID=387889 RepID=A0ABW6G9P9_9PSEU|nr:MULTISPECIES: TetR/AcrR family transcriptional regulator [Prauserella salsuginis group]MCR3721465.1 transcriptional regulator, TetR family [Prauserella flava]MCR3732455.1 transcriptional regulator, TetR family [Prauserella salsuginis]
MPKVVDREARRLAVADATLRLAATNGLEAVSIRTVAAEAGMSPGAVQKYFATKDELLLCALDLSDERLVARWNALPDDAPLTDYLRQVLPLDDNTRAENALLWSFTARAAYLPEWAERIATSYAQLHERLVASLDATSTGKTSGDTTSGDTAWRDPAAPDTGATDEAATAGDTTSTDTAAPAMDTGELAHAIIALTDGFAHRMLQHPPGAPELDTLQRALESAIVTLATASRPD